MTPPISSSKPISGSSGGRGTPTIKNRMPRGERPQPLISGDGLVGDSEGSKFLDRSPGEAIPAPVLGRLTGRGLSAPVSGREAPMCPPLGIRAHIRSLSNQCPAKRSENVTVKYSSKVEIYSDGARLTAPPCGGKNDQSGKHKRGVIVGWSKSSRRRMRDFLLTHTVPAGWVACAVTFTIPGYPMELSDVKRLWQNWRVRANRLSLCAVWRIEIQKRGQLHWHLIVGFDGEPAAAQRQIVQSWHKALRSMGELGFKYLGSASDPREFEMVTFKGNPMDWKGAEKYSAKVDVFPNQLGPWKRYLQDHTTKSKQEQIPENIGRHWGKINSKLFVEALPNRASTLSNKEYARFLRAYNRLCTPYIRCHGALFGRRRGYSAKRGRYGQTVVFSMPETVGRLLDWAVT